MTISNEVNNLPVNLGSASTGHAANHGVIHQALKELYDRHEGAVTQHSGVGLPEGKVSAPVGATYIDTAATNGAVRWIKTSGTGNTGWVVEYGDTGWRDITTSIEAGRLELGNSGYFRARRTERFVEYAMKDMSVLSNGNLFSTPSGFRADTAQSSNVFNGSGFFQVSRFWLGISGATVGQNLSLDREFVIRFNARPNEWPSTLPGTPA